MFQCSRLLLLTVWLGCAAATGAQQPDPDPTPAPTLPAPGSPDGPTPEKPALPPDEPEQPDLPGPKPELPPLPSPPPSLTRVVRIIPECPSCAVPQNFPESRPEGDIPGLSSPDSRSYRSG
jgi:hypothetical protein